MSELKLSPLTALLDERGAVFVLYRALLEYGQQEPLPNAAYEQSAQFTTDHQHELKNYIGTDEAVVDRLAGRQSSSAANKFLELISNAVDASRGEGDETIGQFGVGGKQFLTCLVNPADRIYVVTRSPGGKARAIEMRRDTTGAVLIRDQVLFDYDLLSLNLGSFGSGTCIHVRHDLGAEEVGNLKKEIEQKFKYCTGPAINVDERCVNASVYSSSCSGKDIVVQINRNGFSIVDHGKGMPSGEIFENFLSKRHSTKRRQKPGPMRLFLDKNSHSRILSVVVSGVVIERIPFSGVRNGPDAVLFCPGDSALSSSRDSLIIDEKTMMNLDGLINNVVNMGDGDQDKEEHLNALAVYVDYLRSKETSEYFRFRLNRFMSQLQEAAISFCSAQRKEPFPNEFLEQSSSLGSGYIHFSILLFSGKLLEKSKAIKKIHQFYSEGGFLFAYTVSDRFFTDKYFVIRAGCLLVQEGFFKDSLKTREKLAWFNLLLKSNGIKGRIFPMRLEPIKKMPETELPAIDKGKQDTEQESIQGLSPGIKERYEFLKNILQLPKEETPKTLREVSNGYMYKRFIKVSPRKREEREIPKDWLKTFRGDSSDNTGQYWEFLAADESGSITALETENSCSRMVSSNQSFSEERSFCQFDILIRGNPALWFGKEKKNSLFEVYYGSNYILSCQKIIVVSPECGLWVALKTTGWSAFINDRVIFKDYSSALFVYSVSISGPKNTFLLPGQAQFYFSDRGKFFHEELDALKKVWHVLGSASFLDGKYFKDSYVHALAYGGHFDLDSVIFNSVEAQTMIAALGVNLKSYRNRGLLGKDVLNEISKQNSIFIQLLEEKEKIIWYLGYWGFYFDMSPLIKTQESFDYLRRIWIFFYQDVGLRRQTCQFFRDLPQHPRCLIQDLSATLSEENLDTVKKVISGGQYNQQQIFNYLAQIVFFGDFGLGPDFNAEEIHRLLLDGTVSAEQLHEMIKKLGADFFKQDSKRKAFFELGGERLIAYLSLGSDFFEKLCASEAASSELYWKFFKIIDLTRCLDLTVRARIVERWNHMILTGNLLIIEEFFYHLNKVENQALFSQPLDNLSSVDPEFEPFFQLLTNANFSPIKEGFHKSANQDKPVLDELGPCSLAELLFVCRKLPLTSRDLSCIREALEKKSTESVEIQEKGIKQKESAIQSVMLAQQGRSHQAELVNNANDALCLVQNNLYQEVDITGEVDLGNYYYYEENHHKAPHHFVEFFRDRGVGMDLKTIVHCLLKPDSSHRSKSRGKRRWVIGEHGAGFFCSFKKSDRVEVHTSKAGGLGYELCLEIHRDGKEDHRKIQVVSFKSFENKNNYHGTEIRCVRRYSSKIRGQMDAIFLEKELIFCINGVISPVRLDDEELFEGGVEFYYNKTRLRSTPRICLFKTMIVDKNLCPLGNFMLLEVASDKREKRPYGNCVEHAQTFLSHLHDGFLKKIPQNVLEHFKNRTMIVSLPVGIKTTISRNGIAAEDMELVQNVIAAAYLRAYQKDIQRTDSDRMIDLSSEIEEAEKTGNWACLTSNAFVLSDRLRLYHRPKRLEYQGQRDRIPQERREQRQGETLDCHEVISRENFTKQMQDFEKFVVACSGQVAIALKSKNPLFLEVSFFNGSDQDPPLKNGCHLRPWGDLNPVLFINMYYFKQWQAMIEAQDFDRLIYDDEAGSKLGDFSINFIKNLDELLMIQEGIFSPKLFLCVREKLRVFDFLNRFESGYVHKIRNMKIFREVFVRLKDIFSTRETISVEPELSSIIWRFSIPLRIFSPKFLVIPWLVFQFQLQCFLSWPL